MPKIGALAVAKAHPLVFGAVLAIALGIVVYQLVKPKKQKKLKYSNSSGGPGSGGGDDGVTRQSNDIFYYDPETKSITNSPPSLKASNSDVRKRHVPQNSPSSTNKNSSEAVQKKVSVSKEVQTESVDNNQNIDDSKVLPDKNLDSAMSVDEKINKYFLRNISETDSINSNDESDSTNDCSKSVHKCCCDCESHSVDASSSDSESSSWSNISHSDVKNMNFSSTTGASSVCSVISIESESSLGTILSGDSELCRGCEQNPVNTRTQPCNHRYMCSDCATRIFRLFKRCKVCRAKIEKIVVEE